MIPKNPKIESQMGRRDPRLRAVDPVIDRVYRKYTGNEATITSINEVVPGRLENSLHYVWLAEDLRVHKIAEAVRPRLSQELRDTLREETDCPYWDVVYERDRNPDDDVDTSHIHLELDVRRMEHDGWVAPPHFGMVDGGTHDEEITMETPRIEMVARVAGHDVEVGLKAKIEAATDAAIERFLDLIPFGWIPVLGPILKDRIRRKLDDYLPDGLYEDVKKQVMEHIKET